MARIESYAKAVGRVVSDLRLAGQPSLAIWRAARNAYPTLCEGRGDRELAETFFNSIYCRLWDHEAMLDENLFIRSPSPARGGGAGGLPHSDLRSNGLGQLGGHLRPATHGLRLRRALGGQHPRRGVPEAGY